MSIINLKNPRLRKYIRDTLEIDKYGEIFATLIEEVFVREQYLLELSPYEFYQDLYNFSQSVKSIKFNKAAPNCSGFYNPVRKEIVFNIDYWQNLINNTPMDVYCTKFFETFSHECLHGMQNIAGTLKNRAEGYNKEIKNRSHAIYEICTQGIAAKMARDRNGSELKENLLITGDGYADEIFAIPLIAATFGVSERDVLKYGVRERELFITALDKNIGNQAKTAEFVNKFELQLEYMHSLQYPDDNQIKYKNLSEKDRKKLLTDVVINLVKISQEVLATRIKSTPLEFEKNIAIQYKYDQKKIRDTLRQEIQNYSTNFSKDYNEFLKVSEFEENAKYIKKAINVFDQIGKNYNGIIKNAASLVNAVKIEDFEYCKKIGISLSDDVTFSLIDNALDFQEKKAHEDYNDFNSWDNRNIFEAIYYRRQIPEQITDNKNRLDKWQNLYTPLGYQKMEDLRISLMGNRNKYGLESKQHLLDFFDTPEYEMDDNFYSKFTRTENARECFMRSFKSEGDKEFLAKLIADKYISKSFNSDGTQKKVNIYMEKEMQRLFSPTIEKYNKEQLSHAIAEMLVNDNYQSFSDENCRAILAIYGKKTIFDIISQPLLDEMLNQRRIIPEKNIALQNAICKTETAHPNTSATRIAKLIEMYKETGMIRSELFSRAGRSEFEMQFTSPKDMEDMVGLICNDYARNNMKPRQYCENSKNNKNYISEILVPIINSNGTDYFRENLIRVILYNDYSGFTSENHINSLKSISIDELLKDISTSYIENAQLIEDNKRNAFEYTASVKPADIVPICVTQKKSAIRKKLEGLIKQERGQESKQDYKCNSR